MDISFITGLDRYKDFTLLDDPIPFNELFEDKDFEVVQLHSIQSFDTPGGKDIVGFCGACEWKRNKLSPLDGDTYYEDMLVYGYEEWCNYEEGISSGIDILVEW